MQLKFKRLKFGEQFGASFNNCMVAGDIVGAAVEDVDELISISESIVTDRLYRGNSGPIEMDVFVENFQFMNEKGLFESKNPIVVVYADMEHVVHDLEIDFLEDDEEEIKFNIKERIDQIDQFLGKLIHDEEFDFEV